MTTVTRQRRDCDLNPGPSAPESSTLTTRLPRHSFYCYDSEMHESHLYHVVFIGTCNVFYLFCSFFTSRCYASAVLAMGLCLCPCPCVRLSVTSRSSTKTAKRRITQTTPHDSPGNLVFWCQRSPRNSTEVTPYEGAECRWGGSKSVTFDE